MDYRIESNGTVVVFLSERATHRASGQIPRSEHDWHSKRNSKTSQFVRAGEEEGFAFDGKEFLAQAS